MIFAIINCPIGIIHIVITPSTITGIEERKLKSEVSRISRYIREYKASKELRGQQQNLFSVIYIKVRDSST